METLLELGTLLEKQGGATKLQEALRCYAKALSICETQRGYDHEQTLDAASMIGFLLMHQGKHAEALVIFKRVLEGSYKTRGADHLETFNIMHAVGRLYAVLGQLVEADMYYVRVAKEYDKLYRPDDLEAYYLLLQDMGELEVMKMSSSGSSSSQNNSSNNSISNSNSKGFHAALSFFEKSLAGRETLLGTDHADTRKTKAALQSLHALS